ncbi:MAG: cyclodeaminase/cyclohydrolase family protein [Litorilinea sp.]
MQTAEMTIQAFLDALAARESTPGGGGAAAISASQAAALLSMVVRFTLDNKKFADVQSEMEAYLAQTEALRGECLQLADADVAAFQAVAASYTMPRSTDAEKSARTAALQAGLKGATETPFEIAQKCLALLKLVEPIGAKGNPNVVSDAATALYLVNAALHSALVNVNINLKFIKDEAFVADWSARRDALLADAQRAFAAGKQASEQTLGLTL